MFVPTIRPHIQRSFSQWTRILRGTSNQLAAKVSYCEYSVGTPHETRDGYQKSCSNFAKEVQKIFPAAKFGPYEKAIRFLESSCSAVVGYQTRIAPSPAFDPVIPLKLEVFSSAIIYDLLKDLPYISPMILPTLLEFIGKNRDENGLFSFFVDGSFKPEVDTTSVCLMALLDGKKIFPKDAKSAVKLLTLNTNTQGVVEVYIPSKKEKKLGGRLGVLDAGCLSNMMMLLCRLEIESEAKASEDFIYNWISNQHFLSTRTKHYPPEAVLYFVSKIIKFSRMKRFGFILAKQLLESFGTTNNALALAQRILVAHHLGFLGEKTEREDFSRLVRPGKYEELKREVKLLRGMQNEITGGWDLPGNALYHCSRFYYGSEDIVTAFAAKALYYSQDICE